MSIHEHQWLHLLTLLSLYDIITIVSGKSKTERCSERFYVTPSLYKVITAQLKGHETPYDVLQRIWDYWAKNHVIEDGYKNDDKK